MLYLTSPPFSKPSSALSLSPPSFALPFSLIELDFIFSFFILRWVIYSIPRNREARVGGGRGGQDRHLQRLDHIGWIILVEGKLNSGVGSSFGYRPIHLVTPFKSEKFEWWSMTKIKRKQKKYLNSFSLHLHSVSISRSQLYSFNDQGSEYDTYK